MEQEFIDAFGGLTHTFQLNSSDVGSLLVQSGKLRGDGIVKGRDYPFIGLRIFKTVSGSKVEIYKFAPEEGDFDALRTRIDILEEVAESGEPVVSAELVARMKGLKL